MTILTNLKIWDGVADEILPGIDTIEIVGERVVRLGSVDEFDSPDRDMAGLYVIPGLIDAHVHMCLNPKVMKPEDQDKPAPAELLEQMAVRAQQMLTAGITTARDLGGGQWLELTLRDRISRGELPGPRLICSGQPVTSVAGHCHFWGGEAADLAAALAVVDRQLTHAVDLIKVMATGGTMTKNSKPGDAQFSVDELTQIVARANQHGLHVAAHCHGTEGIRNAVFAGVTTIEHCSWVGENGWAKDYDPSVGAQMATLGTWVSPTINLGWKRRIGSKDYETLIQSNYQKMRQAGVKLIASTDAGIPNVFHHDLGRALPVFAHFAGLTPVEVLRAATSDCAEAIGLGDVAGRISEGLSADMVMTEANPLTDLSTLEAPAAVMVRGEFVP